MEYHPFPRTDGSLPSTNDAPRLLTEAEIDRIAAIVPYHPGTTASFAIQTREELMKWVKRSLQNKRLAPSQMPKLARLIAHHIKRAFIDPGTPSGFAMTASITAPLMQMALDAFKTAGQKGASSSINVLQRIIFATKITNTEMRIGLKRFQGRRLTYREVYMLIGAFVATTPSLLLKDYAILSIFESEKTPWVQRAKMVLENLFQRRLPETTHVLRLQFDLNKLYRYQVTLQEIATSLQGDKSVFCLVSPTSEGTIDVYPEVDKIKTHAGSGIFINAFSNTIFLHQFVLPELSTLNIRRLPYGISGIHSITINKTPVVKMIKKEERTEWQYNSKVDDTADIWSLSLDPKVSRFSGIEMPEIIDLLRAGGFQELNVVSPSLVRVRIHRHSSIGVVRNLASLAQVLQVPEASLQNMNGHIQLMVSPAKVVEFERWISQNPSEWLGRSYETDDGNDGNIALILRYPFLLTLPSLLKFVPNEGAWQDLHNAIDFSSFSTSRLHNNGGFWAVWFGYAKTNSPIASRLLNLTDSERTAMVMQLNNLIAATPLRLSSTEKPVLSKSGETERIRLVFYIRDTEKVKSPTTTIRDQLEKDRERGVDVEQRRVVQTKLEEANEFISLSSSGSNMNEIFLHPLIDFSHTYSNSIYEIRDRLGIEASREFIFSELIRLFETKIDPRQLALAADNICRIGPFGLTHIGVMKQGLGPFSAAYFEKAADVLVNAGTIGSYEASGNVAFATGTGDVIPIGSGFHPIVRKTETLYTQEIIDTNEDDPGDDFVNPTGVIVVNQPQMWSMISSKGTEYRQYRPQPTDRSKISSLVSTILRPFIPGMTGRAPLDRIYTPTVMKTEEGFPAILVELLHNVRIPADKMDIVKNYHLGEAPSVKPFDNLEYEKHYAEERLRIPQILPFISYTSPELPSSPAFDQNKFIEDYRAAISTIPIFIPSMTDPNANEFYSLDPLLALFAA